VGGRGRPQRIRYEWENQSLKKSDFETSSDKHWKGVGIGERGDGGKGRIKN
jgi:hypothetical protein